MTNLHDFSLVTQAAEYVVGLLGLVLWVPFWKLIKRPTRLRVPSS